MSKPRSRSLLADVARLYYVEHLSQGEIASKLSMTRSNVSRVLQAARESGVVEVKIIDTARSRDLEDALTDCFHLGGARVVAHLQQEDVLEPVAAIGASTFLNEIRDKRTAAISWGSTLQAVVESIEPRQTHDFEVVQLVGGLVSLATSSTAHDLVRELGRRLGARYHYLNAPAVFDSAASLVPLLDEASVRDTLALARCADVALVGIGSPALGSSAIVLSLLRLSPADFEEFRAALPVGDICGRYYDITGKEILLPVVYDRVLAVHLADLRTMPKVIGVAIGPAKAMACLGALHSGTLDVLVCDSGLAQRIMGLKARYEAGNLEQFEFSIVGP